MTKKLVYAMIVILLFTGCANNENKDKNLDKAPLTEFVTETDETDEAGSEAPKEVKGVTFTYKKTWVAMGTKAALFIESVGNPDAIFESPSCAFEGIDKILYYPDFIINTFPDNDEDYILSATIKGESIYTESGLKLGMTKGEVGVLLGTPEAESENQLTYTLDNDTEMIVYFENDEIVDITFYYRAVMNKE